MITNLPIIEKRKKSRRLFTVDNLVIKVFSMYLRINELISLLIKAGFYIKSQSRFGEELMRLICYFIKYPFIII